MLYAPWEFVVTVVVAGTVLTLAPETAAPVPAWVMVPLIVPTLDPEGRDGLSALDGLLHIEKEKRSARMINSVLSLI